jgi:hypothetical protein
MSIKGLLQRASLDREEVRRIQNNLDPLRRERLRSLGLSIGILSEVGGRVSPDNNNYWVEVPQGMDTNNNATYSQPFLVRAPTTGGFIQEWAGFPVTLGVGIDGRLEVKGVDGATFTGAGGKLRKLNPLATEKQFVQLNDVVIFQSRPVGHTASPSTVVQVRKLWYDDNYGNINRWAGTELASTNVDLASYIPAADKHRVVVLFLDTVNGTIQVTSSTPRDLNVAIVIPDDYEECFAQRNAETMPCQAYRLENNQSAIDIKNLNIDFRQFINTPQALGFPNPVTDNRIIRANQVQTVTGKFSINGGKLSVLGKLSIVKDSPTITKTSIDTERMNTDLDNTQLQVFEEDGVNLITAVGGITPDRTKYRIAGSGGPVTVTADPPIALGIGGQYLILEGEDDTNTVTLTKSNTLHLHGGSWVGGATDILVLMYCDLFDRWKEISRNNTTTEKAWNFASPFGTSGTFYEAGYYIFGASNNDFSPSINFGTANAPYAAHFFVVTGAVTVDELTLRVTGTSINDNGVRVTSDTDDIVIPNATPVDSYFESKKFIGQVSISVVSGTATQCNYGWSKYYDRNNSDFRITGLEALFTGGANDNNANLSLIHHKQTGWTYNAGAPPTPPPAIADMQTDYVTEYQVKNNEPGAWKRSNLNTIVEGSGPEGIIIQIDTTANKTFEPGLNTFMVSLVPR